MSTKREGYQRKFGKTDPDTGDMCKECSKDWAEHYNDKCPAGAKRAGIYKVGTQEWYVYSPDGVLCSGWNSSPEKVWKDVKDRPAAQTYFKLNEGIFVGTIWHCPTPSTKQPPKQPTKNPDKRGVYKVKTTKWPGDERTFAFWTGTRWCQVYDTPVNAHLGESLSSVDEGIIGWQPMDKVPQPIENPSKPGVYEVTWRDPTDGKTGAGSYAGWTGKHWTGPWDHPKYVKIEEDYHKTSWEITSWKPLDKLEDTRVPRFTIKEAEQAPRRNAAARSRILLLS